RSRRSGNESTSSMNNNGTSATVAPLITSEKTDNRRAFIRSATAPPKNDMNTEGRSVTAAVMPVWEALPVSVRTNQGTAMAVMLLLMAEMKLVATIVVTG